MLPFYLTEYPFESEEHQILCFGIVWHVMLLYVKVICHSLHVSRGDAVKPTESDAAQ